MARPIWKGSITFGLVNIPIQLEMAVHDKTIGFHMMSGDGTCRLRRKLYCPETGKEFDFSQTARGIEIGKGEYVLLDEKEIKRLKPERGRTLEIVQFIRQDEIDAMYFDRVYFVVPPDESLKAYKLLYEAMLHRKRIALARFVMRERQYLSVIRPVGDGLALHTLHYADEVESPEDVMPAALARTKSSAKEVQAAEQLIETMTQKLHLSEFADEYREQLEELIEKRKQGKTMEIADLPDHPPARTVNLMDALRRSLKSGGSDGHVNGHARGGGHLAVRKRTPRAKRAVHARKR
jgi:DNA end-binding protein Ku